MILPNGKAEDRAEQRFGGGRVAAPLARQWKRVFCLAPDLSRIHHVHRPLERIKLPGSRHLVDVAASSMAPQVNQSSDRSGRVHPRGSYPKCAQSGAMQCVWAQQCSLEHPTKSAPGTWCNSAPGAEIDSGSAYRFTSTSETVSWNTASFCNYHMRGGYFLELYRPVIPGTFSSTSGLQMTPQTGQKSGQLIGENSFGLAVYELATD